MDEDRKRFFLESTQPPKPKSKTKYLIGAFVATALVFYGCSSEPDTTKDPAPAETNNAVGQRLKDDNGVEYTLIDNGDGTETAKYDDGKSVTFKRQEDGSLDYLYGTAGLIAGLAAGYYLFHGYQNTGNFGRWDSANNRYAVSEPLKRNDQNTPGGSGAGALKSNNNTTVKTSTPAANNSNVNNATTPQNSTNNTTAKNPAPATNNSKVNLSKDSTVTSKTPTTSTAKSTAKSGFGTAGARGGSAAS